MAPSDVSRHTLSVLVEDVEGILSRVTGMFSRRGYSIISLVSAQTENPGINRLTIVVDASERIMEQVTKQLNVQICVRDEPYAVKPCDDELLAWQVTVAWLVMLASSTLALFVAYHSPHWIQSSALKMPSAISTSSA